jgi:tRNA threonylcarbamoyladenosine biosynthesis protein TsaB
VRFAADGTVVEGSGGRDNAVYDHTAVLILALDTTTRAGSVAVMRDDTLLALVEGDGSRTHGERLPAEIERALVEARVERTDLSLLVVASGPGAFTGLRIGLAAIQGLAMVLGVPVVGVSALDALAATIEPPEDPREAAVAAWMDAARGEVFAANYAATSPTDDPPAWEIRGTPMVGTPAQMLDSLAEQQATPVFVGDGAIRFRTEILARNGARTTIVAEAVALAPVLARLGRQRAARGEAGPPHALQPLYVRRPDAELERARRSTP